MRLWVAWSWLSVSWMGGCVAGCVAAAVVLAMGEAKNMVAKETAWLTVCIAAQRLSGLGG